MLGRVFMYAHTEFFISSISMFICHLCRAILSARHSAFTKYCPSIYDLALLKKPAPVTAIYNIIVLLVLCFALYFATMG